MRLVLAPDSTVNRYDRAIWLSIPFDLAWLNLYSATTPTCRTHTPTLENRTHTPSAESRTHTVRCP